MDAGSSEEVEKGSAAVVNRSAGGADFSSIDRHEAHEEIVLICLTVTRSLFWKMAT